MRLTGEKKVLSSHVKIEGVRRRSLDFTDGLHYLSNASFNLLPRSFQFTFLFEIHESDQRMSSACLLCGITDEFCRCCRLPQTAGRRSGRALAEAGSSSSVPSLYGNAPSQRHDSWQQMDSHRSLPHPLSCRSSTPSLQFHLYSCFYSRENTPSTQLSARF